MVYRPCFPVLVAVCILAGGCERDPHGSNFSGLATAPALPSVMQGDWHYNEPRTVEHWKKTLKPEQYKSAVDGAQMMKSIGVSRQGEIRIIRNVIIGRGGTFQPRWDLVRWNVRGGVIEGTAWHHEDFRDPGDMAQLDVKLQIIGDELHFDEGEDGEFQRTIYTREAAQWPHPFDLKKE